MLVAHRMVRAEFFGSSSSSSTRAASRSDCRLRLDDSVVAHVDVGVTRYSDTTKQLVAVCSHGAHRKCDFFRGACLGSLAIVNWEQFGIAVG